METIDISNQIQGVFNIALKNSKAGEGIIYHSGPYASGPHRKDALMAALEGKCFIIQRRIREGWFAYIAIKASEKYTKSMRGTL